MINLRYKVHAEMTDPAAIKSFIFNSKPPFIEVENYLPDRNHKIISEGVLDFTLIYNADFLYNFILDKLICHNIGILIIFIIYI